MEDFNNPELQRLRRQEHLDRLVRPGATDIQNLLALAQWMSHLFPATTPFPNYPPVDALRTLDMIRTKKTGGFCAQYAYIFGQACQSFGFTPRYFGIANRALTDGHVLTEVYVPSLKRWVAFEPQYGYYYVDRQGAPLNLFDLHARAVGKSSAKVFKFPSHEAVASSWLDLFYHFRYQLRNNFISLPMYVSYRQELRGTLMIFEPYSLRWVDRYTRKVPEVAPTLPSSVRADFDWAPDLTHVENISCYSMSQFVQFVQYSTSGPLYKMRIPKQLLKIIIEKVLIGHPGYQPLQ